MHTSNTFLDCDRMFISDFLFLDDMVAKEAKNRMDTAQALLQTLSAR